MRDSRSMAGSTAARRRQAGGARNSRRTLARSTPPSLGSSGADRAGRARDRARRLVRSNVQRLPMPQTGLALNRQWAGARSSDSRTARRRVVGANGFSRNPARLPDGTRSATAASAKPDTPCSARRAARASVAHRRSAAPYRGFSRAKRRVSCRARSSTAGRPGLRLGCVHFRRASLAMPAQKRVRGHDQPLSAPVREQAGERRDEGTVGGPQGRAATLPAEHDELMSEHEQLDVFGELAAPASDKQPQNSREREIGEGEEHPPILPEPTTRGSQTRNSFETPQAELLIAVRPRWPPTA